MQAWLATSTQTVTSRDDKEQYHIGKLIKKSLKLKTTIDSSLEAM